MNDSVPAAPAAALPAVLGVARRGPFVRSLTMWLLAALMLATGVWLSWVNYLGTEWLSRAGCVIVTLGIWSSLGGMIEERLLLGRLAFRRRVAMARARRRLRKARAQPEQVQAELLQVERTFSGHADALEDALRFSVGVHEVALLSIGTLVWGFGDLMMRLVPGYVI